MTFKLAIRCLFALSLLFTTTSGSNYKLEALNVIFRHGDRTPLGAANDEYYPTDPYANETYYPSGLGSLTKEGKLREYAIGESLRKRYDDFLGPNYVPSEVKSRSTDTDRTKMSALLVLAGLYPPEGEQVWKSGLNWQPVPVNNPPQFLDTNFKSSSCPIYKEELARVKKSPEYLKEISKFQKLMKELSFFTGKKITDTEPIFFLYHLLTAQRAAKLVLPAWTKQYYPDGPMREAAMFEYHAMSYNNLLKKFNGGMAVQKVLNNFMNFIKDRTVNKTKVFLQGAHETNIAGILVALDIWKRIIPEYSSTIVFELHEKDSKYFIKTVYYIGIPQEFEVLTLPGCTEYCPLADFKELNKAILPNDAMETCFGPVSDSKLVPKNINPIKWMYEQFKKWFDL